MAGAVGNVRVNFTGSTGGLDASADSAASRIEAFGGTVNKSSGAFINFNTKMLESRRAIGLFAATVGTSVGPLMHFVHSFGILGPVVGGAVASLLVLKEVYSHLAEEQKRVTAENLDFINLQKRLREFETRITETAAQKELNEIGKEATKIKQEQFDIENKIKTLNDVSPIAGAAALLYYKDRLDELNSQMKVTETQTKHLRDLMGRGFTGAQTPGVHRIETAVKTSELGVFKLEHSQQSPQVVEQQKTNSLLAMMREDLAKVTAWQNKPAELARAY